MSNSSIQIGQVRTLISGGPQMVVSEIQNGNVTFIWQNHTEVTYGQLRLSAQVAEKITSLVG